jgi:ATP-binding cassette, subfamily B, bacterial PglK
MEGSVLQKIWGLLTREERRYAVGLLGLMLVGMVLETLGVGLVIPVITLFTQPEYAERLPALRAAIASVGTPDPAALVTGAMLVMVAVYLFKAVFLAVLFWCQNRFAFDVQAQLSQRLFTIYLRQPYTFHLQHNSAELLRNVTSEVSIFTSNVMSQGMLLLTEILVLVGLCTLLLIVEPVGALVVVTVLGATGGCYHYLTRRRIASWGLARQHHEGARIQHLQQGLGGIKDVKLLGREADFLEQYRVHNTQFARVGQRHTTLLQVPRLWLELLAIGGLATLVITLLARGRALETVVPTLSLFAAAAFRFIPSVNRLLAAVQAIRYGLPVVNTLAKELQLAAPAPGERAAGVAPFREHIELTNIVFTYPGAPGPSLRDLSLAMKRGESVGIIGTSGAGKSTLVDVLLGLLTPEAGRVEVDGEDIQSNLRGWQNQIGYVPQAIFLTDDSLRRNIAFGLPAGQIDEVAVWRSLRAAQLDEFVRSLPQGLETVVGERGVRLSGGQRQRIGIARALYHDPALLVMDEATSSLDTDTERGVMEAVRALSRDKTVVIVAHRLSTIENCDRLFRIEEGRANLVTIADTSLRAAESRNA